MLITEDDKKRPLPAPPAPAALTDLPPPYPGDNEALNPSTTTTNGSLPPGPRIPPLPSSSTHPAPDLTPAPNTLLSLPRQNYLHIERANASVKGTYLIDPSLPPPPGTGQGMPEKEMKVWSFNGEVNVGVYLMGEKQGGKGRVELEAGSRNGAVKLAVRDRPQHMHVHITAKANNGSILVLLPPHFRGPLTITHLNGGVTFRPSLAAVTRTFEETRGENRCWVGEWEGEGDTAEGWRGDECVVWAANGGVKVGFWEGERDRADSQGGFFMKLFGLA